MRIVGFSSSRDGAVTAPKFSFAISLSQDSSAVTFSGASFSLFVANSN